MENTIDVTIYSLSCPYTNKVKYIGKAKCLKKRLYYHFNSKLQNKLNTKLSYWLRKLQRENKTPIVNIIENCGDDWGEREKYWIRHYGIENLCNTTLGGEGKHGTKMSDELKMKISLAHKGKAKNYKCVGGVKNHSTISKNKISESKLGVKIKGKTIVFSLNGKQIKIFNSLTDASDFTGDSITSISNNLKNISLKTKNGKYEYI